MTKEQSERLVVAWEAMAKGVGELNEIARSAISKQWPDARERREPVVTHLPTAEEKIKAQTGNTDGSIAEWLGEFDDEQGEIGPREAEFLARAKASSEASGQGAAGPKASRRRRTNAPIFP